MSAGSFVISLDFELYWGVRDVVSLDAYRRRLLGVREAIPAMLELFTRYEIAATWATVGFLFAKDKAHLEASQPSVLPTYADEGLSPYPALPAIGNDEKDDPFHYGPSLLDRIAATPRQEIGTHTFSHYYCLEPGQTEAQFAADLEAAARISWRFGSVCKSLVFPRNQYNPSYRDALRRAGVVAYRSNGHHWAYRARAGASDSPARRAFRLADAYIPLSGRGVGSRMAPPEGEPVDVPASAFLRPFSPATRHLRKLQTARLQLGLSHAATMGGLFHLWWHPHNFGLYLEENLATLEALLREVDRLRHARGFKSQTMSEAADWMRTGG